MREGGRRLAADDGWRFVNEGVIPECLHHEQSEVDAAGEVALEDGVTDVKAPNRQPLALALLKVAASHDSPARITGEHAAASLHLVLKVDDPSEPGQTAE
jgi:hypothetical protein